MTEETIGEYGMRSTECSSSGLKTPFGRTSLSSSTSKPGSGSGRGLHNREVFDKPDAYYSLEKLRKAASVDRRLSLREIIEKSFGLIQGFKSKDELLEEEFDKFVSDYRPEEAEAIPALKNFFKAYVSNDQVRYSIENHQLTDLATNPVFTTKDLKAVPQKYRAIIPNYIKDYVPLNRFMP
jgi:type I restriction enzyme R subunit